MGVRGFAWGMVIALVAGTAGASAAFRGVDTELTGRACRFITGVAGVQGDLKRCQGMAGFQPETVAEHTWVTFRIRTPAGSAPSVIFRGFTVDTRMEWRVPATPAGAQPVAAIIRVTPKDMDTLDRGGPVLMVVRLERAAACLVAVVDARARPDAIAVARRAADGASGFACGRDRVETVGPATRWTRAVIDWPRP
jgi:hypothetical protein